MAEESNGTGPVKPPLKIPPPLVTLAILGAAFIVGGIVAYRGSARTGVRAFGASAVAAGVVMWAVVVMTVPLYSTGDGPQGPR